MEPICKNCRHFRQHYIKYARGNYSPLAYGHCVEPRIKRREAATKACSHYKKRPEA